MKHTVPESEAVLVGTLLNGRDNAEAVVKVSEVVSPEAFAGYENRQLYKVLLDLQAKGEPLDLVHVSQELGRLDTSFDWLSWLAEMVEIPDLGIEVTLNHATAVSNAWHMRQVDTLLSQAKDYLSVERPKDGGLRMADSLSAKLLEVYADRNVSAQVDRIATIDRLIRESEEGNKSVVDIEWPKLNDQIGPLVGGELLGITAYSGGGKSTFAGNLFAGFCRQGTPCIYFPTEMGASMLARIAAAESRTSQKRAEKRLWVGKEHQRALYQEALDRMKEWPFDIVPARNITPEEVLRRTKILRQKWEGRPVVVFVDHLHRLDYGSDPNKSVGKWTREFKNFAGDNNVIFVLLYQPRKPEEVVSMWRPVAAHQIRGDSMVWNELDVHISPFRTLVKTTEGKTPWGTPRTLMTGGVPWLADLPKMGSEIPAGAKLSDEHIFLSIDKRRIGGAGPTVVLAFDARSGKVAENEWGLRPPRYQQTDIGRD